MAKKAVLIGCNYPGTTAELRGCINDVQRMYKCLIDRYGFSEEDISILIDTDDSYTQPTGENIRKALDRLVRSARPGDYLFVHYSGHGIRLPAKPGDYNDTGFYECIVPCDMNLITGATAPSTPSLDPPMIGRYLLDKMNGTKKINIDDEFRDFVDKVPEGCWITIVSDSCHSGGLIDECKEQIGDSHKHSESSSSSSGLRHHNVRNRSLPLSTLIEFFKQRPTLFDIFGDDSNSKVKKFIKFLLNKLKQCDDDDGKDLLVMVAMDTNVSAERCLPDCGILISGCQSNQTSADVCPSGNAAAAYGALSNAIQTILAETEDEAVSNQEIVLKARQLLKKKGFYQRPGLYCGDHHANAPFVC